MTRNSFKRKVIVFGIMIFASIALISTGFAAWIISSNSKTEQNGSIQVGTITDNRITIKGIKIIKKDGNELNSNEKPFIFEPNQSDKDYIVRGDDGTTDAMEVTLVAEVTNFTAVKQLSIKMQNFDGTNGSDFSTTEDGILKADSEGYITAPDCAKGEVDLRAIDDTSGNYKYLRQCKDEEGKTYKDAEEFSLSTYTSGYKVYIIYTIEFKWGSVFGYDNPSVYYGKKRECLKSESTEIDTDAIDKKADEANTAIENFRKALFGTKTVNGADVIDNETKELKFLLVIAASAEE